MTFANHLFAEKVQNCDSVESVTALLQEEARAFTEFQGGDGKIMKSLNCCFSAVYPLR
jgi:hypothetical protein